MRVERHIFKEGTAEFKEFNCTCLLTRNLHNVVQWLMRQHFFKHTEKNYTYDVFEDVKYKYLNYRQIYDYLFKTVNPDFKALPANVAQEVIRQVVNGEWASYRKLIQMKMNGTYDQYVGIPNYLKEAVPYNATYNRATLSKKNLINGIVNIPKSNISVKTEHADTLRQVKVSYSTGQYCVDVIYEEPEDEIPAKKATGIYLAIDCGVDNFATIVSNAPAFTPLILDGRELKSKNRFFNKKISVYTEKKALEDENFHSDEYTRSLWADRKNWFSETMHLYSRRVLDLAELIGAEKIIIGHCNRWKDKLKIHKGTKQNFAFVPFNLFITDLQYKSVSMGIEIVLQEESYTSKASFFDDDYIAVYGDEESEKKFKASGKRVKRGLYRLGDNKHFINADVNGALNILRKYLNVSSKEIIPLESMGCVITPVRVRLKELREPKWDYKYIKQFCIF